MGPLCIPASLSHRPRTHSPYCCHVDLRKNRSLFPEMSTPQKRAFSSSRLVNNGVCTRKILNLPRSQALTRDPHGNSTETGSLGGVLLEVLDIAAAALFGSVCFFVLNARPVGLLGGLGIYSLFLYYIFGC